MARTKKSNNTSTKSLLLNANTSIGEERDDTVEEDSFNEESSRLGDILSETMISLRAKESRSKKATSVASGFTSLFDLPEDAELKLEPFTLQYAFGTKSFKPGTIAELIGPEHVGKTTFVFTLFGMFMRQFKDSPFLYVCTEGRNKLPDTKRILRCLSTDKREATSIMKRITMLAGYAQKETLEEIDSWCKTIRENMTKAGIDETIPIFVAIDTLSKLMPKSEAGEMLGDAKAKGLGESSNLEFSKMMQEWTRKRAWFTEHYGVFMLLVSHQNTKINMTMMPGARPISDANNKTKIGGHATDQTATTQFTLTRVESEVNTLKDVVSHIIKLNVVKNSRGIDRRSVLYALRVNDLQDEGSKQEMALDFDYGLPELFAVRKLLGTRMLTKQKFTCTALGVSEVNRRQFAATFNQNEAMVDSLGKELCIYGYDPNIVDPKIVQSNADLAAQPIIDEDDGPSPFAIPEMSDTEGGGEVSSEEVSGFDTGDL